MIIEEAPGKEGAVISAEAAGDGDDAEPVEVLAEIPPPKEASPLTASFLRLRGAVDTEEAKNENREDDFWQPVLAAFARAVAASRGDGGLVLSVASDGTGNGILPRFHARLALRRADGSTPERFLYLRAILRNNVQPFKSRLRSFMEEPSGETAAPSLRRAVVIFPGAKAPLGKGRPKYCRDFLRDGGLVFPTDPEIRAMAALAELERGFPAAVWADWVRCYRPLDEIHFLDHELAWFFGEGGTG